MLIAYRLFEVREGVAKGEYTLAPAGSGAQAGDYITGPARCLLHWHREVPEPACECGYHAVPREGVPALLDFGYVTGRALVLAEVALWGRIVEHEQGFRAQYMGVRALFWPACSVHRQPHAAAAWAQWWYCHACIERRFYPDAQLATALDVLERLSQRYECGIIARAEWDAPRDAISDAVPL